MSPKKEDSSIVVCVCGLPGSGKSFFARAFASLIAAEYISSDVLRKRMFKHPNYSPNEKLKVYLEMLALTKQAVTAGNNSVLDATFFSEELRTKFRQGIAGKARILFIEIVAFEPLIQQRVQRKRVSSDADWGIYKQIKNQWEPIIEEHLILESTDSNISQMLGIAADYCLANDQRANRQINSERDLSGQSE